WREFLLQDKRPGETFDPPLEKKTAALAMAIRVREVTAQAYYRPGPERWPIMEKLSDDRMNYYVSNLPENVPLRQLPDWARQRWTVEQGYRQLKEELGLDHFEGRSWRGLHHHRVPCFMAYGFLTLAKHKRKKKP
ncbi:MAG: transposase, partial [Nitrospinae bacterium]|nr:transposase [Nitrospinota bacterium]